MFAAKFAPAVGSAAALLLLCGVSGAQVPFDIIGNGCTGESGTQAQIFGNGFPSVGGAGYSIDIASAPSTPVLLGFGVTPIAPAFPLDGVGLPGCTLDVLITVSVAGVTDATGVASFPLAAPVAPGSVFFLQGYAADAGPSTSGATTAALQVTTLPMSTAAGGEIIVTEFLRDPNVINDSDGEWVELYNTTGSAIDVEGWFLGDDDFDLHQIDAGGAGVLVPAGGYALFGANADPLVNGGITLDYQWADFFLSNSTAPEGDEIVVRDQGGALVDRIAYNNPGGWPLVGGQSASLDAGSLDAAANDDPTNWCANATDLYDTTASANTGTPGGANPVCPDTPLGEQGAVIITEVMQNPAALGDSEGEYFEVYNTTVSDIDMIGWTISDLGGESHVIASSVLVPAGGYATLAVAGTPGFTPDYVYGSDIALSNGSDELVLTDATGAKQDEVLWDGGPLWPDPNGSAMNFDDAASKDETTNNDPGNWCTATVTDAGYTSGDVGSPGVANEVCGSGPVEIGDIIVTEILQNPSSLPDDEGEFFEVYNTTGADIDMLGWTIGENLAGTGESHVIATSVVVPTGGYATFARTSAPGFVPDYVYGPGTGFQLNNSTDAVYLRDAGGALQDFVQYDNGATFPDPNGSSMNFDDAASKDATTNNDGSQWCAATTADIGFTSGDNGSPGVANETCL
ncbi:MAG: lamin tail domain-containing protein [Planctomycetota bacterium]